MKTFYRDTVSTCHKCGQDIKGIFWESPAGIYLETECPVHGIDLELVEKDVLFFSKAYEYPNYSHMKYLIVPVTYRCNLSCKYCYAHSNYKHQVPEDRSIDKLVEIVKIAGCQTVNLAGGEPTVRKDLPELLAALKKRASVKRLCVVTNGQKTTDEKYLKILHESGMDFLFLPLYIAGYEPTGTVMGNVIQTLDNAYRLKIPVWIQATIERVQQIRHVLGIVEKYKKGIFSITIRSVRPYGITEPGETVHVSDIIKYLGLENDYRFGNHPFNRHVRLWGRKTKISHWVNDRKKLDPYDATYVTHDDTLLPFHKGMIIDDIYFKAHKSHC
ncbi:MAG: radical SAM protein [Candidatus Ratteibacteria bacterium]|jgi:MoaA/NifB/PqqE/SkfB family radical SAM enzyme